MSLEGQAGWLLVYVRITTCGKLQISLGGAVTNEMVSLLVPQYKEHGSIVR